MCLYALLSGRAPVITQIIGLTSDNHLAHSQLKTLQTNMLTSEYHGKPLIDVLSILETKLAGRRATINAALAVAAPTPTITSVVDALLSENASLGAGAPGGSLPAGMAGSVAADKDGHATTLALFKNLEATVNGFNLDTEVGRRDALAAALVPGNVILATRTIGRRRE